MTLDSGPPPAGDPSAEARYWAEATYRLLHHQRRHAAGLALAITLVFGLGAVLAGFQWLNLRGDIDAIQDRQLAEGFGIEIPDPRPALQRTDLRVRAFAWGVAALWSCAVSLLALAMWSLLRPPAFPTPPTSAPPTSMPPPDGSLPP